MMNDKDLQRKMKEQQIKKLMNELLDSYEDELPKMDEKMAKKIKMAKKFAEEKENELKLEKDSRSEKYRIADMLERIENNENVLDMLGFIAFKDGNGFLFGKSSDYTFEIVSLMITEMYEQICDDETDDAGFEDFLNDLADNARMARMFKRGLSE
jgi:hypothetical protein